MSSIPTLSVKQIPSDSRNFVPLSCLMNVIYGLNEATTVLAPASWATGSVSGAAGSGVTGTSKYASSIAGVGAGKLRDMGKTYVSSGRAFRKVQLIVPAGGPGGTGAGVSTFGVAGDSEATAPTSDYLTGYIELGWEGQNIGAPVARSP